uniref:Uncharacterized protein n=1 Tax=Dictyoglomus turgidum TaxID=513050 RepID=A0A7C3WMM8_9BACT
MKLGLLWKARGGRIRKDPQFFDYFTPGDSPQRIRLIQGDYRQKHAHPLTNKIVNDPRPFYIYRKHWYQKRTVICGKDELDNGFCLGCDAGERSSIQIVHTIVHLAYYHDVEYVSKEGRVVFQKDNKPLLVSRICEGKGCPMCKVGKKRYFGKKKHWSLSETKFAQIVAVEDMIGRYCKCGEEVEITGYKCPDCGTPLDSEEGMCQKCAAFVRAIPEYHCKCGNPRPLEIYDIDLSVKKTVTSNNDWELTVVPENPVYSLKDKYKGIDTTPFDFSRIFPVPTIEEQRMIWGNIAYSGLNKEVEYVESEEEFPQPEPEELPF